VVDHLLAVVVTYNSEAVIGGLLDSLPAAMGGVAHTVVVVDNGSSDGTVKLVQDRPGIRLVRSENVGYSGGLNRGVREAGGGATSVLILNPDLRLAPGAVPAMLAALQQPGVGIVAPKVFGEDGELHRSLRREPSLLRNTGLAFTGRPALSEYVSDPAEYERGHVVDWALGAVLLMARDCYDALGGWDESYFLYSEETDFCLRARELGWRTWYEPAAQATHIGGGSGQSGYTHAMQIVNRVRLYRRRHSAPAAYLYYALTVLSEVSWVARGHTKSRTSLRALLRPSERPKELGCGTGVLPS
jgi:GT2 family glycosyltransferase